jgi:amidohydrolase
MVRIHMTGAEIVKRPGPLIVASNHIGWMEILVVAWAMWPRRVRFMGKRELFEHPAAAWAMRGLGVFPINREHPAPSEWKEALRLLREGYTLGILAAGTRGGQEAKSGAARLALASGATLVTARYEGPTAPHPIFLITRPRIDFRLEVVEVTGREGRSARSRSAELTQRVNEANTARHRRAAPMPTLPKIDVPTEELVRYRRHFHAHPELSLQEFETAAFIERELRACEFDDIRTGVGGTGILATLKGGRAGPVTLLRADMDALPMDEVADVPYRSTRAGAMHACGHDGHMAILLSVARALSRHREHVAGTIVFCFQPAEEGPAGNKLMIEDGALENPHVDRCFALHLYSGLEVGKIGVRDGAFFASSDRFDLTLRGRGGHGAMPQTSVDPIVASAQLITMLQTIASREIAPKDPVVVTVGALHSGTTFNVIPDLAEMRGTVRAFSDEVRTSIPERMERMVEGLCDAMRLDYEFEYLWGYPPTVNDPAMNDIVREVGATAVGAANVTDPHDVVMWAEDMSYMMEQRPGAYFVVGVRGLEKGIEPQHSARYDIDEAALGVGFTMMVGLALYGE